MGPSFFFVSDLFIWYFGIVYFTLYCNYTHNKLLFAFLIFEKIFEKTQKKCYYLDSIISLLLATDFGLFSVGLCLGVLTIYMGLKTDGIFQLGTERERVMIISTHPPWEKDVNGLVKGLLYVGCTTHTIKAKKNYCSKKGHAYTKWTGQNKEFNLMVTDAWMV